MARPRSESKRGAIVEAAIHVVADEGLGASTATISKQAGVAQGSLFNYFAAKSDLLNAIYIQLKRELNEAVLQDLPVGEELNAQLRHLWTRWLHWGTSNPKRRRALTQLNVSDQISRESRAASFESSAVGIGIIQLASASGPLKDLPIDFIGSIVEAIAGTTMDQMILDPDQADDFSDATFRALCKALA